MVSWLWANYKVEWSTLWLLGSVLIPVNTGILEILLVNWLTGNCTVRMHTNKWLTKHSGTYLVSCWGAIQLGCLVQGSPSSVSLRLRLARATTYFQLQGEPLVNIKYLPALTGLTLAGPVRSNQVRDTVLHLNNQLYVRYSSTKFLFRN